MPSSNAVAGVHWRSRPARGVELGVARIARTARRVRYRRFEAADLGQCAMDRVDAGLNAGADDVAFARSAFERGQIGARDVAGEDVVASLLAIPVNAYPRPPHEGGGKYRDHAGFAVGILTRTVHIAVA